MKKRIFFPTGKVFTERAGQNACLLKTGETPGKQHHVPNTWSARLAHFNDCLMGGTYCTLAAGIQGKDCGDKCLSIFKSNRIYIKLVLYCYGPEHLN